MQPTKNPMRQLIGLGAAVSGAGLLVAGATLVALPLGLIVGGLCLLYVARAVAG